MKNRKRRKGKGGKVKNAIRGTKKRGNGKKWKKRKKEQKKNEQETECGKE